jgi:hypothetical protein
MKQLSFDILLDGILQALAQSGRGFNSEMSFVCMIFYNGFVLQPNSAVT